MPYAPATIPTMNQVFWAVVRRLHQLPLFAGVEVAAGAAVAANHSGDRCAGWNPEPSLPAGGAASEANVVTALCAIGSGCGPAQTDAGPAANNMMTTRA